jgi:hypothetical protein
MAITPRFSRLLPRRLKVKALLEATFAPVFTRSLDRPPLQVTDFKVTSRIDPNQPAVIMWLVPHFSVKILKVIEPKFDTTIVVVACFPAVGIATPVPLPVKGVVDGVRVLGWRLPMPEVRGTARVTVKAAAGPGGAVTKLIASNPRRVPAVASAQIDAAMSLGDASLSDDTQTPETLTWLVMNAERLAGFNLQTAT